MAIFTLVLGIVLLILPLVSLLIEQGFRRWLGGFLLFLSLGRCALLLLHRRLQACCTRGVFPRHFRCGVGDGGGAIAIPSGGGRALGDRRELFFVRWARLTDKINILVGVGAPLAVRCVHTLTLTLQRRRRHLLLDNTS
jgi:hypothetical protein